MNLRAAALVTISGIICLIGPQSAQADTKGDPKLGKEAFKRATCEGCHPGGGNVMDPDAPLKGAKFAAEFKDDAKIIKTVRSGIKGTAMPAFNAKKVSDKDMKDIVAYLRSLTPKSGKQ